jgi:hypothetical protein
MYFKNGLPFDTTLAENIECQLKRIESKKASCIIIDGSMGEGKTTLAIHIADFINGAYDKCYEGVYKSNGNYTNLKTQYAMGGEEFLEKLQICYNNNLKVCIYDESGDYSKRAFWSDFNKRLNRVFETYRAFKIVIILVMPNFSTLDKHLLNNAVPRFLVNCYKRGLRYGTYRVYALYRMYYIAHKMDKLIVKQHAYSQVTPNFYGQFYDLEPDRSKILDDISKEGKLNIVTKNILDSQGLISLPEMTRKLRKSRSTLFLAIKKLKLEPKVIHKKIRYYERDAIYQLEELLTK